MIKKKTLGLMTFMIRDPDGEGNPPQSPPGREKVQGLFAKGGDERRRLNTPVSQYGAAFAGMVKESIIYVTKTVKLMI
jgi:hypothetical protein